MFSRLFRAWFGDFTKEELKKFGLLSGMFFLIIGTYWILRPMKDSIFMSVVGRDYIPQAKFLSLFLILPLVMIYTKLLERFPRHRMFYALCTIYAVIALIFAGIMMHPSWGLANPIESSTRIWGWLWYVYVESFGSLIVALFWAFTTDTTKSKSAADGFRLISFGGQLGNIFGPVLVVMVLRWTTYFEKVTIVNGQSTMPPDAIAYGAYAHAGLVVFAAVAMVALMALVRYFMKVVPQDELEGFEAKDDAKAKAKKETGLLDGLKLLLRTPYLLGIFFLITFYEVIVTIFDFNFKALVAVNLATPALRTAYLGHFGIMTGVVSFVCVVLGVNRIQKILGVGVSLILLPIMVAIAAFLFQAYTALGVLFWIMVFAKAFNYALNQPTMKQLYIPTSKDAKYKAQAFIETYGSRGSKAMGSSINNFKLVFQRWYGPIGGLSTYMSLCAYASMGIIGIWIIVALAMGRTYTKATRDEKLIC